MAEPLMQVTDLTVSFPSHSGRVHAVGGISYSLQRGETLTILGESGSGKSVGLKALMGLLPAYAKIGGSVRLDGTDVLTLPPKQLAKLRGGAVSMIFQEPMAALDPVYTIGEQISETIVKHEGVNKRQARKRALEMLEHVRIPSAARRMENFPHEMSGGMRQRAMIALALACSPSVLLADEPTTALDVTVQIQILLLLRQLQQELGMAVVFVTHDVGVAAEISDRVAVMYAGRFVETGTVRDVLRDPRHPYTAGLLDSTVHGAMRGTPLNTIAGSPPSLAHLPPGCAFTPRCRFAVSQCQFDPPVLRPKPDVAVRCIHDTPVRQLAEPDLEAYPLPLREGLGEGWPRHTRRWVRTPTPPPDPLPQEEAESSKETPMTDDEFNAAMTRSGLPLTPETLAEIRKSRHIMEGMIARVTRDKPREAEPATVFYPEQRP